MPSWSSLGAKKAVNASSGVADGLFSWAAWPQGANDMFTTVDQSYFAFLGGKSYMMPISPWFYTNMPGFRKNWMWRGDDLWFDRWQQVLSIDPQPEYLEIITWNDWGESHYIGPLRPLEFHAFNRTNGKSPFNYVEDMPHDGWREFLPYTIDMYKFGSATISKVSPVHPAFFSKQCLLISLFSMAVISQEECSDFNTCTGRGCCMVSTEQSERMRFWGHDRKYC